MHGAGFHAHYKPKAAALQFPQSLSNTACTGLAAPYKPDTNELSQRLQNKMSIEFRGLSHRSMGINPMPKKGNEAHIVNIP